MSEPPDTAAEQQLFGNYQYEIYARGLAGETPTLPLLAAELQETAREHMSHEAFSYVAGAAGAELTVEANRRALAHWEIVPRMLRDVSVRDLSVSVLGTAMPAPVMLAPIGVQSIVHADAELAVARAAAAVGL
ncbi:MAG TPA: alpha-hydroxy-acid oxidizing protein, partial [Solirubrobacteraceae bacterium]